ncbi:MAG: nucleotidyltransferase domain-containing protein [Deltaproteobacteria bacterium]|nr:nucleotidyltransferase domain-containing protein [Deltaproteobacteria bacterium]
MALSKNQVNEIIKGFVSRLMRDIPVDEVILFGSYAHGTPEEHSDIDLAVISDWFRDKTRIEGMQYLSRIAARYNTMIEAIPFTTEEYKNLDKRTFLGAIVRRGKPYHIDADDLVSPE